MQGRSNRRCQPAAVLAHSRANGTHTVSRLLLLSGGLDSALCLQRYGARLAIGFDYGQPHVIELEYAERIAARYETQFERHRLPDLPKLDDLVFSGRNAVMLAVGVAIA